MTADLLFDFTSVAAPFMSSRAARPGRPRRSGFLRARGSLSTVRRAMGGPLRRTELLAVRVNTQPNHTGPGAHPHSYAGRASVAAQGQVGHESARGQSIRRPSHPRPGLDEEPFCAPPHEGGATAGGGAGIDSRCGRKKRSHRSATARAADGSGRLRPSRRTVRCPGRPALTQLAPIERAALCRGQALVRPARGRPHLRRLIPSPAEEGLYRVGLFVGRRLIEPGARSSTTIQRETPPRRTRADEVGLGP